MQGNGIGPTWHTPYAGGIQSAQGSTPASPFAYSGGSVTPVTVPNQLPSGYGPDPMALANRTVSTHPSSLYVNVPGTMASALGQMQDMMHLRDHTGMYAGFLDGVNHFTNCVINIQQGNPVPPAADQRFQLWQSQPGVPVPVPVPMETIVPYCRALPSGFGQTAVPIFDSMRETAIAQLLHTINNLEVQVRQLAAMGCNRVIRPCNRVCRLI